MTFKDSLQWVDHLNSKQHLHAVGQTDEVAVATLEMVVERLEWLKRKKTERESGEEVDLAKRLAERARQEEEERKAKREKRRAERAARKTREVKLEAGGERFGDNGTQEEEDPDAVAMARMMGFTGGFGTTKKG